MQRYFSEQNFSGNTLNLSEDVYKHAVVVMRMKAGSKFELVTPDKVVHVMELVTIDSAKKQAVAHECERFEHQVELPVEATIVCGLPKNDKTDLIVMKATELGVSKIVFFAGDWSVARWAKQKQAKKLPSRRQNSRTERRFLKFLIWTAWKIFCRMKTRSDFVPTKNRPRPVKKGCWSKFSTCLRPVKRRKSRPFLDRKEESAPKKSNC